MLGVLVLLALVIDDRHVGLIADGRQMIRTAVALAERGGIGQPRGRDFTIERPRGDAVSRFGMATSLLQVPAVWLAARVEPELGPGSSQALFLVLPWLAVGIAGAAAGAMARRLGATDGQVVAAVLLATLASPLASYAALEFSEPLQAAALALALASSLAAAQSPSPRAKLELAAGLAAGFAVLTKSSLLVVAPATLLPLVDVGNLARTWRTLARTAAGSMVPLAVWAAFEIVRFGHFFGGYPDDRFTHPWLDGVWRLLAGPNRGLLFFWPALLLFAWAARRWRGRWLASPESRAWLGALVALVVQIAIAAGYWGWHGMEGWGPRLVVAALPLLAPFAATALAPSRGRVLAAVVALTVIVNLPPLLQHPTPVATYVMNLTWPEVPESEAWRYPFYASGRSEAGRPTVVPFEVLETESAANPWRVYLWFWRASRLDDEALAGRLRTPPWHEARPDLVPARPWPPAVARQVVPRWQPGFLGRSLTGTGGPYARVYAAALLDQVVLANQMGDLDRALALSDRVLRMNVMDGEAAAWRLETLRRTGRAVEAEPLLRALPETARRHPLVNVALALFDRDFGEEARARALLHSVAPSFPGAPLQQALTAPLATWPATLDAMTDTPRRDATVDAGRGR
ncbi:MAG: hypothetical protein KJ061_16030 [Vicinamibacteraceae bacterium]|nr:hypothetical protein [Vicinamibacteraceae bacterium]